ncbi:hypothetical protein EJ08DRAFT_738666 [Tothia fuscella]|uniref:Uncharacterized protein n=1 Tax=Tothia fuscella TaxID=1048955 RepID=A0A9P4TTG3_9PEZI|nr:hypothetical protein EJ08DRAFT_738666 [Tothia fuscella]
MTIHQDEKMSIDPTLQGWSRQLTPPHSPVSPTRGVLPQNTQSSSSNKMSLDFIAPGSCLTQASNPRRHTPGLECLSEAAMIHSGLQARAPYSPVSTSSSNGSEAGHTLPNRTLRLPSPSWSSCSDSGNSSCSDGRLPKYAEIVRRVAQLNSTQTPRSRTLYLPSQPISHQRPQLEHSYRIQKRSITPQLQHIQDAQRGERPGYDPEGRYAIIYLRGVLNLKWLEVEKQFTLIFPPGQPRRCQVTGLPTTYQKRNMQGLQCRWYRIREEEGLKPLREGESGADEGSAERRVLEKMVMEGKVSKRFVGRIEDVGQRSVEVV